MFKSERSHILKLNIFLHQCCRSKLFFLYLGPIDHVFEETYPTIQVILNQKKIRIWIQIRILFGSSSGLIFLTYLMLFIDFSYKIHSNSTKFTILSNKKKLIWIKNVNLWTKYWKLSHSSDLAQHRVNPNTGHGFQKMVLPAPKSYFWKLAWKLLFLVPWSMQKKREKSDWV